MYSTAAVTCNVAPGSSIGRGYTGKWKVLIKEQLGDEFGYEWTSVAYQETQAGTTTTVVFVMALVGCFPCACRTIRKLDQSGSCRNGTCRWRCSVPCLDV